MWLLDHASGLRGMRWQEYPDEGLDPNHPTNRGWGITEGSVRQPGNSIAVPCAGGMQSLSLDHGDKTCGQVPKEYMCLIILLSSGLARSIPTMQAVWWTDQKLKIPPSVLKCTNPSNKYHHIWGSIKWNCAIRLNVKILVSTLYM